MFYMHTHRYYSEVVCYITTGDSVVYTPTQAYICRQVLKCLHLYWVDENSCTYMIYQFPMEVKMSTFALGCNTVWTCR
jgi:hypothetical protein